MTTLVTGGAGFIGSHLIDALIAQGEEVICLDDFSTGRRENLAHLERSAQLSVLEWDVTEPFDLDVDRIYNLACPASPPDYQRDPVRTTMTSVLGARHVLELAQRTGARVLQASTSEVYGDPEEHPQRESYFGNVNPIGIRSCYDEGKRVAESLFFDYQRSRGVDIKVVRIFNTFGPRMREDDGRVVSNFIVQAISGQQMTVYGSGEQTRSFCYVSDLVRGIIAVMEHSTRAGPYNLGNPEERTIAELAREVAALAGCELALEWHASPSDDPRKRRPDITKVTSDLGWKPEVPLRQGLELTLADFRRRAEHED